MTLQVNEFLIHAARDLAHQQLRIEPEDARYLSVHRGHLMIVRPEEEHLIGGDLIKALSFTATAPELRERIHELGDAGYSQISFHIRYGQDETVEEWAELVATV